MSVVDFSDAVIEVYNSNKPLRAVYLGFTNYNSATTTYGFIQPDGSSMWRVSVPTVTVVTNTPTKYSISFTGTFADLVRAGTEFLIEVRQSSSYVDYWRISNISFSNGDTYSFVIDIDVIGS